MTSQVLGFSILGWILCGIISIIIQKKICGKLTRFDALMHIGYGPVSIFFLVVFWLCASDFWEKEI